MNGYLMGFLSRKFISAHLSIIAVFIIVFLSKYGVTENVAMAAIGAISGIALSYQAGNALAKGKENGPNPP